MSTNEDIKTDRNNYRTTYNRIDFNNINGDSSPDDMSNNPSIV